MGFALLSQYFGRCISYFKGIHKFPERSFALVEMERGIIGLNGLKPGEKGWIERMTLAEGIRLTLEDMGFVPGSQVECVYCSPFGDPVAYYVMGTLIAIRVEDARNIQVKIESGMEADGFK